MFFFVYVLKLEITGVIIAYMLFGLVTTELNLWSIYKITGYLPEPMQSVLLPVGASFAVVLVCLLVSFVVIRFAHGKAGNLLIVLFAFILGFIVYIILIFRMNCVTKADLLELPAGKKIVRMLKKVRLV